LTGPGSREQWPHNRGIPKCREARPFEAATRIQVPQAWGRDEHHGLPANRPHPSTRKAPATGIEPPPGTDRTSKAHDARHGPTRRCGLGAMNAARSNAPDITPANGCKPRDANPPNGPAKPGHSPGDAIGKGAVSRV